jgi:4-aminobutyrate aminotransferase-like enzyme
MNTERSKNMSIVEELGDYLIPNNNSLPVIVSGKGAEVLDEQGRRYLDLEAGPGVVSVGHCHERVVTAVREQAGTLMQGPGRNFSRITLTLAKRLSDQLGNAIKRFFFANSGAEANDGAIKIALKHALASGKQGAGVIAFDHGFHGRLSLALSLTGQASKKKGLGPYASFPGVVHALAPYCYRCPLQLKPSSCGMKCADMIEDLLLTRVPGEAAIMIAEPIIGVGGVIVPPDQFWPKVREICSKHKITVILDEVFTGFGRTGKTFAHQHWNLKPDIVTFAKAIGGGLPMAGFATTDEIAKPFDPGDHFTTFGSNNQVGIAAAHAVLDILRDENLADKAKVNGAFFISELLALAKKFEFIGDVRGCGLMIGVELVHDRIKKTPAPDIAKTVQAHLREQGVLISLTGVHGCVLRITPPLVITKPQIERALAAFDSAFSFISKGSIAQIAKPG